MAAKPENGQTRVLLVGDDPDQAALVRYLLEAGFGTNHEFVHVDRISDAREALVQQRVTCVLLDLSLPDARALSGLVQLRTIAPDVPRVAIVSPGVRVDPDRLIETADFAMYGAKKVGMPYRVERVAAV